MRLLKIMKIYQSLPIKKDVFLEKYSTIRIGGRAKYFISVDSIKMLQNTLLFAKQNKIPYVVVGRGSNTLFSDRGFDGLVIHINIDFCHIEKNGFVSVGAGCSLIHLSKQTINQNLSGLEFALAIPASVGGAIYMNAGASNQSFENILESALFVQEDGILKILKKDDLQFSYRKTCFMKRNGVIASAVLKMKFCENAKINARSQLEIRRKSQPISSKSLGCFFKNPKKNVFAAKLIDGCDLKGYAIGGAKISEKHANFFINENRATAEEMKKLIKFVKKKVFDKYNVFLEEEIKYVQ
jgi:UDP-N-acetylmuramate dehydrogenase